MGTLTDDDLRHLLGEGAASFDVPTDGARAALASAADAGPIPLHRRRWLQVPAAAAAVAAAVLAGTLLAGDPGAPRDGLVGLAGGGPESGSRTAGTDFSVGTSGETAVARDEQTGTTGAAAPAAAPAPAADRALTSAAGKTTGSAPQAAPPAAAPVPDGARVVKTGAIALIVEDGRVTPTLTEVQGFAAAAGGVVANAKTQESGPTPSGSVVLRVPVDSFEEVVARVRGMGAEVRSATTSGQDVTAQYADLEAQLRTLSAARERFLEILSDARTIGDVLAVQQRVDDVTGRIDRLEGRRRVLAAQSDSATLEVTVTEEDDPVVAESEHSAGGLQKAFADAWDGFASGVEGLIRLSGRGVLLLLCLAAGWLALRVAWRASRRRLV